VAVGVAGEVGAEAGEGEVAMVRADERRGGDVEKKLKGSVFRLA